MTISNNVPKYRLLDLFNSDSFRNFVPATKFKITVKCKFNFLKIRLWFLPRVVLVSSLIPKPQPLFGQFSNQRQMKSYSEKLLDPRWQRKRLSILQRDNFTCTLCMDDRSTLAVHHTEYSGNPWDIADDKLITICHHCHDIIHGLPKFKIEAIHKKKSTNNKCWECVAFTDLGVVFLYLFFVEKQEHTGKVEIIKIFPNESKIAA